MNIMVQISAKIAKIPGMIAPTHLFLMNFDAPRAVCLIACGDMPVLVEQNGGVWRCDNTAIESINLTYKKIFSHDSI